MIPKLIHFVYGLDSHFSHKPFTFFHYLAILSAKKCNNYQIFIHVYHEPENNEWWEKAKSLSTVKRIDVVPSDFFGKKIVFTEHKCDFIRLKILQEYGGIYLDIDTICVRPMDIFLDNTFVMGKEISLGQVNGLCNAVIISEAKSQFGKLWLDSFSNFNPYDWNLMAVRRPWEIMNTNSSLIHVEPSVSFFKYDWHTIIDLFNGDSYDLEGVYVIHLWESKLYHPILKHITKAEIFGHKCCYNNLAKKYLENDQP